MSDQKPAAPFKGSEKTVDWMAEKIKSGNAKMTSEEARKIASDAHRRVDKQQGK